MPLVRRGRPLKRWRYVGVFSPELMLAAADVRVGPLATRFYAVALPDGELVTAAPVRRAAVRLDGARVHLAATRVRADIELDEDGGVETLHPSGSRGYVWTRKQAGIRAHGTVSVGGRAYPVDCRAVVDDTAGYHERHTAWRWSAGVGKSAAGERIAWNLVSGVNDAETGSERALWVDGSPREVGPVAFAADLSEISFEDGGGLRFAQWSARESKTNLLIARSYYRAPFGTFSGELPGGISLCEGYGVMEEHEAYW